MKDDAPRIDIPPPLAAVFELVADAFDALEAATEEPFALDLFFEEIEFEGEEPRLCLTLNDAVSAYHEDGAFTVVLTATPEDEPHPWFRRETPHEAAVQIVQLLLDAALLDASDAAILRDALGADDAPPAP